MSTTTNDFLKEQQHFSAKLFFIVPSVTVVIPDTDQDQLTADLLSWNKISIAAGWWQNNCDILFVFLWVPTAIVWSLGLRKKYNSSQILKGIKKQSLKTLVNMSKSHFHQRCLFAKYTRRTVIILMPLCQWL